MGWPPELGVLLLAGFISRDLRVSLSLNNLGCTRHSLCAVVRRQPVSVSPLLLPCEAQRSDRQAQAQAPFPVEPHTKTVYS